ncbi:hybrid sensor histidine kinase/response regulator [Marinospirillum alkaliphilum]|uniref:histidine kinase n=1 Tax=Marinospirillum alkaliphilum DSM 21637 TaxID=1122209 RepID=A0A1K1VG04_9GAMM|nr:NahK/ErcS family hybrid sensor histidine kinase/response regulator [Marinospirillum alkaliphilum]SFX23667.1 PAS domain S-box-containing protein [Marinospirillum alkaliphilum DSM 21637]
MFAGWQLILFSLAYLLLLFAIAWQGDRAARRRQQPTSRPWIYSLALTVYCTSWTFYGAVGQAAGGGWLYLSIFIGPILTYFFAWPLLRKIFRVSKAQNITSIADFIASRYGKWQLLAVLVTLIALVGTLPYIALQLKAVAMAYEVLTSFPEPTPSSGGIHFLSDTAFHVALALAVFAILFGTRHIDATEHHEGLLRAIAFESLIKLFAFLAVGIFITWGVFGGFNDLMAKAEFFRPLEAQLNATALTQGFLAQTLLAMVAIILLPRMFHVTVVENAHRDDARYARWFLPLYLTLFAVFVMPIAAAGLITFPDGRVESDTFVLTLPLAFDAGWLALLAYIGGFSAATSMAIMATVAVSIMVSSEIVIPFLLKTRWTSNTSHQDFGRFVLRIRRLTMLLVMLLGYLTYRTIAEFNSLAATGFLAFAAIGQLAPAALGGILWKQGNRWGALAGLLTGAALWIYTLLLPSLQVAGLADSHFLSHGPFNIDWLRPSTLFGMTGMDYFTQGVLWSLSGNLLAYTLVSRLTRQRVIDRIQASAFVDNLESKPVKTSRLWKGSTNIGDLRLLAERFVGADAVYRAFRDYAIKRAQPPLKDEDPASIELIQFTERLLAGVLGASSARIVMSSALQGKEIKISDVISIVDEASQVLEFNRSLLQSTIENLSQGISVVDQHLSLVIWNQRYLELFHFPDNFIRVGRPAVEIFRYNAERGEYGPGDPETHVQQLLDNIRDGEPHRYIRYRKDGSVLEIQGNPMPGGGFVYSYQDITQQKQVEEALIQSENNIRIYTDNVPALIAYFDTDRRYLFTNRAYEEAMGIDRNQVIGQPVYKVLPAAEYEARNPFMRAALEGRRQTFELELPGRNRSIRYALVTYTPHLAETGEVLGFFALYQDITERRLVEIALQETNEHLEERVRERTLALSELNSALFKENQVRARAEEDMRLAKQQAEDANASKTRFLAAASHDLLQPLNAARLFTSALSQQVQDPELQKTTRHIDNSLKAAEELLSTLLDISKLDAGALQPKISDFPLSEILDPLKAEFSVMAAERDLQLHQVKSRAWVRSDAQMLRRILQNFLSNALRYTGEGKVLIGCRRHGQSLRIEVWDTGPGIPEIRMNEIFQEFRRLDTPDKRNEKGLGLGLSIAERMSRVLDHPITVRSWPGQGTLFAVTVPQAPAQHSATGFIPGKRSFNKLDDLPILCIDNEPLILEGMQAMLQGWKCVVATAENLPQASRYLQEADNLPEIYLADYHLNDGQTGVMALQALEEQLGEKLSGIIITADRTDVIANEVHDAGFQLLHKPVKPAALRAMITRLLQTRRRQQGR